MSIGRDSGMCLGLGLRLGVGLDIGMGAWMDVEMYADGVANIFSSCCVDILSESFTLFSLATFNNTSVVKLDILDIIY